MPFHRWTLAREFTGCLLSDVCFSAAGAGERCTAKGERRRIRHNADHHRMCFSASCSQSGRRSKVIPGCITLQICGQHKHVPAACSNLEVFFERFSQTAPQTPTLEMLLFTEAAAQIVTAAQTIFIGMKMKLRGSREGQESTANPSR